VEALFLVLGWGWVVGGVFGGWKREEEEFEWGEDRKWWCCGI
jgi:hypothetical protein